MKAFSNTYSVLGQPFYYGSFAQVKYEESAYGYDLVWYLTGDVVSAGTSGYRAEDIPADRRCHDYNTANCLCDDSSVPTDDGYLADSVLSAL